MADLNELTIGEFTGVLNYLLDNNRRLQEAGQTPIAIGLEGEAGIGKTAIVEETALKRGMTFCKLNLSQLEEVGDITGFPIKEVLCTWTDTGGNKRTRWWPESRLSRVPSNVTVTNKTRMGYAPPAWLPQDENPNGTILLIDDFTRGNPLFMQAIMELINTGSYISWTLPKFTSVCLTSNPEDGSYNVSSLDNAQKTRFVNFNIKLNVEDWAHWAEFNNVDSRAINFGLLYGDELFQKHNEEQTINPRAYTSFCKAISGIKDWEDDLSLALILNISKGCFLNDKDNVVGQLFTTFIANKLDKLVTPKDMLLQGWDTVEPRIYDCTHDGEKMRTDIASMLGLRLMNYILYYFSQAGAKEEVVQNRILDFVNNPRKLVSEDILFHLIKTIIAKFPARTTKLLIDPKIRAKVIV